MAIPSLTLDLIMSLDTESKAFWDPSDVEPKPLHPVQVLELAYGLAEEGKL
jgi:hypothetical protein